MKGKAYFPKGRWRREPLRWALVMAAMAFAPPSDATGLRGKPQPRARNEASSQAGTVTLKAPQSAQVFFPAGRFQMGSAPSDQRAALAECARLLGNQRCAMPLAMEQVPPNDLLSNEVEPHLVTLDDFWLDRTEVSVRHYGDCVRLGRCKRPPYHKGARRFAKPRFPVSFVTWQDAQNYCHFRGGRLPTEAEWERAASGGKGRLYPWGQHHHKGRANGGGAKVLRGKFQLPQGLTSHLLVGETDGRDGFFELAPVGSFPAGRTPEGLLDMAGNVAEWVNDVYVNHFPKQPVRNPGRKKNQGRHRVIRGGSYKHAPLWQRAKARLFASGGLRSPWVGFRCAYDKKPAI